MRPDQPPAPEAELPLNIAEILRLLFASLAPSDHLAQLLDHVEGRA